MTSNTSSLTIRNVTPTDLDAILAISTDWALKQTNDTQSGFLVSDFDREELAKAMEWADHFYVAIRNDVIVGYALAYSSVNTPSRSQVENWIQGMTGKPYLLIKQIVTLRTEQGQGVASALYRHLAATGLPLAAAIVLEPKNERSIAFHEHHAFRKIGELTPPPDKDGISRRRGIWYRENAEALSELLNRQSMAITLYLHEDNLNWTKLGMLVGFIMAILGGFGFVSFHENPNSLTHVLGVALPALGFALTLLFQLKINSGLYYMGEHKKSVRYYDALIAERSPMLVPLLSPTNSRISQTSLTTEILKYVPYACYLLNLSMLITALFQV